MENAMTTTTGNCCRSTSAIVADAAARRRTATIELRPVFRLLKTAHWPPATLFAALARGASRCGVRRAVASGTRLATRHAAEGTN